MAAERERCDVCGSTEFVSVKGHAALAAFPSGRRCANFFGHGLKLSIRRSLCGGRFTAMFADAPFGIDHVDIPCEKIAGHVERGDLAHYGHGEAKYESDETLVELTETRAWYDGSVDMTNRPLAEQPPAE